MAKGDHGRMQDEIGEQKNLTRYGYGGGSASNGGLNPNALGIRNSFRESRGLDPINIPGTAPNGIGGMENLQKELWGFNDQARGNYDKSLGMAMTSYDDIMNAYKGFGNNQDVAGARSTYGDMASTGGVDGRAIRDRAMSGVRSVYDGAKREVNRSAALAGGYAPNRIAAQTQLAREGSIAASDASTNAEASLAELISRNRLAGAGGLANLGQMDLQNTAGMANMYQATPGLANMFGNQVLNSQNNLMQGQNMQNNLAQMFMNARAQNSQIPGNFAQAMGNIGGVLNLGGKIAGGLVGLGGGGATGLIPGLPGAPINPGNINVPGVGNMSGGFSGLYDQYLHGGR
jgi:hypothetical protein